MTWHPYDGFGQFGAVGTEGGRVVRDEQHSTGARMTLEDCTATAHAWDYAIACGGPSGLMHTAFFRSREDADAAFEAMQRDLIGRAEIEDDDTLYAAINDFVTRY